MMLHKRSVHGREWAVCGEETLDFVEDGECVTCLACQTNTWLPEEPELLRVLTKNSVKDMQYAVDDSIMTLALDAASRHRG